MLRDVDDLVVLGRWLLLLLLGEGHVLGEEGGEVVFLDGHVGLVDDHCVGSVVRLAGLVSWFVHRTRSTTWVPLDQTRESSRGSGGL